MAASARPPAAAAVEPGSGPAVVVAAAGGCLARRAKNHQLTIRHDIRPYAGPAHTGSGSSTSRRRHELMLPIRLSPARPCFSRAQWRSLVSGPRSASGTQQPAGEFAGELPADDENVDEVKRLKNNVRLVGFDRENDHSWAAVQQIRVE